MSSPAITTTSSNGVRIAIVGCGHGELDRMYECLEQLQQNSTDGKKVDLLLVCGDFQSVRNYEDLACMACPQKYRELGSFFKYYNREKIAPVLTIFIGGNHEASNYLVELFHGGWVAPNIYYMGFSSIMQFGGLRLGGLSGIFDQRDYRCGHYERAPFDRSSQRSVYHVREFDMWRLLQYEEMVKGRQTAATPSDSSATAAASSSSSAASASSSTPGGPIDIFMSHDWPTRIAHHGDTATLLRRKKFLEAEIKDGSLGSPPAERILKTLQPKYWFSAHLHVKFPAVVRHENKDGDREPSMTQFLALNKCLPHKDYMQLLDFPLARGEKVLAYDPAWLALVKSTYPYLSLTKSQRPLPAKRPDGSTFAPTSEELSWIQQHVPHDAQGLHRVPLNFVQTAPGWRPEMGHDLHGNAVAPPFKINPQTLAFLDMLKLKDTLTETWSNQQQHQQQYQHQQHHNAPISGQGGFQSHLYPHAQMNVNSPPISHQAKKQRIFGTGGGPIPAQPALHTNPEEIDLDAVDMEDTAPAPASSSTSTHDPEEIPIDDLDEPAASAAAPATGNPEDIALDDI